MLDTLATLHYLVAPSVIASCVSVEFGVKLSRNAVWQALRRLKAHGLSPEAPGRPLEAGPILDWFVRGEPERATLRSGALEHQGNGQACQHQGGPHGCQCEG